MTDKTLLAWTLIIFGIALFFIPSMPKIMNYFIITIYAVTAIWWARQGSWVDVAYWISAAAITITVTFGYGRHTDEKKEVFFIHEEPYDRDSEEA